MQKKHILLPLILLALTAVMAGSCYGRRELEELSLVTIIGIDKGDYKPLLITTAIALPRQTRGGRMGGGGEGGPATLVVAAEGNTLLDALAQITTMTSRRTTTAHTQIIILGEELALDDAGIVLDVFSRNLEFRHNTLVSVSQGKASDFISQFSWPEETEPSDYLTKLLISCNRALGICPVVSIHDFLIAYSTGETEPWAPYLALASPKATSPQDQDHKGKDNQSSDNESGRPIVAVLGAAVFKTAGPKIKMAGTLDTKETMAVNMLRGEFAKGFMEIAMPEKPEHQSTLVFHHYSISSKANVYGGQASITFKIRATASIEETTARELDVSPEYHEKVSRTSEQELEVLLSKTLSKLQSMNTDVINLGMIVHKHFKTWPEWNSFDWPSKFKNISADYDIRIFVLTTGFTVSPPSPK